MEDSAKIAKLRKMNEELLETCKLLLEALSSNGDINRRSCVMGGPTYVSILKKAIIKAEKER